VTFIDRRDWLTAAAASLALAGGAQAQTAAYPSRPIKLLIGFAPGGAVDIIARAIGQQIAPALGQPVVVENKPGAGTNIAMRALIESPPDGYTLMLVANSIAANQTLYQPAPYDMARDFTPVALVGRVPVVLAVNAAGPLDSIGKFIAEPKAKPRAVNYGSPGNGSTPHLAGVSVDLAREAARRLGLPIEWVNFNSAGAVVEAVKAKQVDLAFVAIDPVRAADMEYTAPYAIIEGACLVRNDSALQRNDEVDRAGTRVAVGRGSAYDLFLTRELKAAALVRAPTSPAVVDHFLANNLEVAAGVKQQLEADARRVGGGRLLPGRFMVIEQAMGVPKGRTAAQAWLASFVEEMEASGFVAQAPVRHRIEGAAVAPPAAR
jgi:polar amino acid transport system substrate-binding protein